MTQSFHSSEDALRSFVASLSAKAISVSKVKTIKVSSKRGFVYQKQIWTQSREIYHVKYWSKRWIPLDRSKVYDFAQPWNERLKYVLDSYGNGDPSVSGINESTLVDLLGLRKDGYEAFLITIYQTGEILWCRVDELYDFVTQYSLIPEYSRNYGEPFCWVPTGWMREWADVLVAPPALSSNV